MNAPGTTAWLVKFAFATVLAALIMFIIELAEQPKRPIRACLMATLWRIMAYTLFYLFFELCHPSQP